MTHPRTLGPWDPAQTTESLAVKNCRWQKVEMISLRLNRPNNFEVFSELIIQVLFRGEKLTDILLMVVMKWIT